MDSENKKIAHLFHWPSFREYQESLLQVIALPIGARGKLKYNDKWVNKSFIDEIENINNEGEYEAIFWVLSCKETPKATFDLACPIRSIKILNVNKKGDYYYIDFVAQEFISGFSKIDNKDELKKFIKIEFDDIQIPYPGVEKGFAYTGPEIAIQTTDALSLKALYEVLENIPCSSKYKEGITMKEYPLIKIEKIVKSKINDNGLYELSINQEYVITLFYYQGESYRDRIIYINENEFIGQSDTINLTIEEKKKSIDKLNNIIVRCNNLRFIIPLNVFVKIPWHKWRFTPLLFLFGLSIISIYLFMKYCPDSEIEVKVAVFIPLSIMLLNKLFEVLSKKD